MPLRLSTLTSMPNPEASRERGRLYLGEPFSVSRSSRRERARERNKLRSTRCAVSLGPRKGNLKDEASPELLPWALNPSSD